VRTAAIILAGGASRRMGSPKALLTLNGITFADGLIDAFADCDELVVVLGYDAERIRAGISRFARFVVNPNPELGQLSSLKCGLKAVPDADAIFFTPVDYPAISRGTVSLLLDHAGAFAMPRFEGRRGHPVLLDREISRELLACETSARDVIRAHDPVYVDVSDPGILEDVDDPASYARLQECSR
jgi:molybdenum cofactor cytidylyltransferase